MRDFMRVPCPAARITTARSSIISFQCMHPDTRIVSALLNETCQPLLARQPRQVHRDPRDRVRVVPYFWPPLRQIGADHLDAHALERGEISRDRHLVLLGVTSFHGGRNTR